MMQGKTEGRRRGHKSSLQMRKEMGLFIACLAVTLFFSVTFIWPLGIIFKRSIGSPLYNYFLQNLSEASVRIIIWRTFRLAIWVTLLTLGVAYPAAYGLSALRRKWRNIAIGLILLPWLTSFLVRTYAWMAILGSSGPVVATFRALGLDQGSLIGTFPGLVIAMVHMLLPLMVLPIYAAMSSIDRTETLAAMSLGARPAEAFVRVYMPQTLPGVFSGSILVFMLSLGFFITPALIGGLRETTVAELIYLFITQLFEWGRCSSLSLILLATVMLTLFLASRIIDLGSVFGVQARGTERASGRPRRSLSGSWLFKSIGDIVRHIPGQEKRLGLSKGALLFCLAVLDLPLLIVFAVSFQTKRLLAVPVDGVSFRWYRVVLGDAGWLDAGWLSLRLAVVAAFLALAIGYFSAWRVQEGRPLTRQVLASLCLGPIAVPIIILAVGIYGVFIYLGFIGQFFAVAAAHASLALPYVFINILNGLAGYDKTLDLAAASLGAKPMKRLLRVKIPMLMPAFIAATTFAFLISFEELVVTLFIAGIGFETLPLKLWAGTTQNLSPELASVGTILILVSGVIGGGVIIWMRKRQRLRQLKV